ncbi:dihydrolipoamide acetyltransferase component (E2) of acetoin dehydrogenase complex [Mizugakiibacter sediminis]|uniref:Dihydrolipoamide acetyltransferase component of pyruvate dehydrogenase complex n=1 Tax=Mizugakiibacter sediminis TaxID=1475481 RepID=A0A0K8QQF6_9GAMM|nr:dihydrolipoamide acetyltransferase family protein [Mizugakiibacter sediminis]GAP66951.1 dihydrolipoamide acetyltransferase component (E2) of acetoin dehydrogenase complex [Mizugakiibacter sediminis]
MIEFRMPALGADMEAGTLVEWLKRPGERIARGDPVAVVETQKGAIEIESFQPGVLAEIRVDVGRRVPVGEVLALIRGEDEAAAPARAAARPMAPPALPGVRISPAARRLAEAEGIDVAALHPGADGNIGLAEVEAARAARPFAPAPTARTPAERGLDLVAMRQAIAAAMARSQREIPHYFVGSTLELSTLLAWLEHVNAARPPAARLLYLVPLLKAMARALAAVPELNGHFVDGRFVRAEAVHIGVAVALRGGGLIAPAIHGVDRLDLDALMAKLDDLVLRVRGGRLRGSELADPTITVSNLGERTADALLPVIYPPQVAIVGCGQIAPRPWAVDGALAVRPAMTITVAGDHRVSDGRSAARFLARVGELLQAPEAL